MWHRANGGAAFNSFHFFHFFLTSCKWWRLLDPRCGAITGYHYFGQCLTIQSSFAGRRPSSTARDGTCENWQKRQVCEVCKVCEVCFLRFLCLCTSCSASADETDHTGLVRLHSQLWRFSCISTTCRPVKPIKIFGIQVQEDPWCGAQNSHHCFLTGLHTDVSWTEGRTASSTRRMHTRQAACQWGRTWTIHVLAANLW